MAQCATMIRTHSHKRTQSEKGYVFIDETDDPEDDLPQSIDIYVLAQQVSDQHTVKKPFSNQKKHV